MTTKKKHAGGRPPKITLAVVNKVAEQVALGVPLEYACILNDIKESAWHMALSRHKEFVEPFQKAKAGWLAESLQLISQAGEDDGKGGRIPLAVGRCWILERRHSDLFSRRPQFQVTGNNNQVSVVAGLTDEEVKRIQQAAQRVEAISKAA